MKAWQKKLQAKGLTEFQIRVLLETLKIPKGETRSYGQIAKAIGKPGAARAVGTALKLNPFPITIPCHRVIHSNGSITGYSGSTDPNSKQNQKKRALLKKEKAIKWLT